MPNEMAKEIQHQLGLLLRQDAEKAEDLYRALAGNTWQGEAETFTWSEREAGEEIARIRTECGCPDEDWRDYEHLSQKGKVSPWVRERLEYLGYRLIR